LTLRTLVTLACVAIAGCAFAPRAERMRPQALGAAWDSTVRIDVGSVTGGGTSSFWTTPHLDAAAFRTALEDTLRTAGLRSPDTRHRIDARIEREQLTGSAIASRDTGADLAIRYVVIDRRDGTAVWNELVDSTGWVRQAEVFVGVEHARRAIEVAARANLRTLLERLVRTLDSPPSR
jgi:hypothetical protein